MFRNEKEKKKMLINSWFLIRFKEDFLEYQWKEQKIQKMLPRKVFRLIIISYNGSQLKNPDIAGAINIKFEYIYTIFAKDFDMNKLLKFLWRGRKQGRCGRSPKLKIEKYAHIYLVFADAREISKVCSYRSPWQTVYSMCKGR